MRSIKLLTLIFSFTAILLTTYFLINTGTSSQKLDKHDSQTSKESEPNIESLSKRYFEITNSDNQLLYGVEYYLVVSVPERFKNHIKNGRIEIELPKKVQSIFGVNIEEINNNEVYEIINSRAVFDLNSSIATSNMTIDQKNTIKNNNDFYTIKIYSNKNKLIKSDVIKVQNFNKN
ncbi:hypothetical protein COJ46_24075 [Bacillus sp. AFS077874]|uniref:hypothetical protein n=1 Tax=unclassified Bacillus (in: firmicutes) TaxID=185979 RepID=UPI000BED6C28|nr:MULTISPECIES: hypothetical protein [unclassified Bacillus (in: firmicutes)]PEC46419.1 hypothetical protein CON00_23595 [Bacillus sp. AFS096315]PFM74355.1 hypothetical protein COJ46_24075 [Bacillus sp. AFS077874]